MRFAPTVARARDGRIHFEARRGELLLEPVVLAFQHLHAGLEFLALANEIVEIALRVLGILPQGLAQPRQGR